MDNLTVSIFQPTARDESPASRLNWLDMAANRAASQGSDLLICPELSLTGYRVAAELEAQALSILGEYSARVSEIAALHELAIVYGYPEQADGVIYNTAAFVTADGKMLGHHRKNHIPPGFESELFTAGDNLRVFEYAGCKIALLIGYDIEFPEAARQAALAGAEILIVPNSLGDEWAIIADNMVRTRALENGIYVVFANWAGEEAGVKYLGASRIIAPDGAIVGMAGKSEQVFTVELHETRIAEARARLPYLQDRRQYGL